MSYQSISSKIFGFIENKFFSDKKDLLIELEEILHLQRSSVYKKVRGESALSLEEAEILCKHFRISLDDVLGLAEDKIYFDFPALYGSVSNEKEFLDPIFNDLVKLKNLDPVIYYATKELPLFYYFFSMRLIAFKFHVFYNFIWRKKDEKLISFDFKKYSKDEDFKKNVSTIHELYSSLNSIEIWNTSVLDNSLNQIKYFLESGLFTRPQDSLELCNDLENLIDVLEVQINNKKKSTSGISNNKVHGSFELYNNEIAHTNNVIFVKSETRDAVYCTYDNPNFMRSISPQLCQYTENWFNKLLSNSIPITFGTLKDKMNFINQLREKLNRTRTAIQLCLKN